VVRGHAERNAVNAPVQGSAADCENSYDQNRQRTGRTAAENKMLLQVHDELVFEAPADEIETASKLIKTEMENALKTQVPLLVEIGVGITGWKLINFI
jgi:DNA polymerase-1